MISLLGRQWRKRHTASQEKKLAPPRTICGKLWDKPNPECRDSHVFLIFKIGRKSSHEARRKNRKVKKVLILVLQTADLSDLANFEYPNDLPQLSLWRLESKAWICIQPLHQLIHMNRKQNVDPTAGVRLRAGHQLKLSWKDHVSEIREKATICTGALSGITGSTWGGDYLAIWKIFKAVIILHKWQRKPKNPSYAHLRS